MKASLCLLSLGFSPKMSPSPTVQAGQPPSTAAAHALLKATLSWSRTFKFTLGPSFLSHTPHSNNVQRALDNLVHSLAFRMAILLYLWSLTII